jgi:polyisoprenoid-binding protein YceI
VGKISFLTALIFIVLFSSSVFATALVKIDQAHSGIIFEIDHIFSVVKGKFSDFSADIRFDKDNFKKSSFDFTVRTDSISTGIGKRDRHLRSADFFDTDKYPEMRFRSTDISHVKGSEYIIQGLMTVKDVTQKVSFRGEFLGSKVNNPFKNETAVEGFETKFQINRLDYHVGSGTYYNLGVVGDKVDVLISLKATE